MSVGRGSSPGLGGVVIFWDGEGHVGRVSLEFGVVSEGLELGESVSLGVDGAGGSGSSLGSEGLGCGDGPGLGAADRKSVV